MTTAADYQRLLQPVTALAREAGSIILEIYATDFDVRKKADKSPVTEADIAAHRVLVDGLRALTPGWPVLSEESAHIPYSERERWQRYWLVDPLDGTREFVKRNGEFTVNVALIVQHQPVLGAVYAPVLQVLYYACHGGGAYKSTPQASNKRIHARRAQRDDIMIASSRSHSDTRLQRYLQRLGHYDVISMGSSLKSCLVAEGKADLYPRLGQTSEWDTAAAQCVVEEAGGGLTDIQMQPLSYNRKASLLNPHFFVFGDPSIDWSKYLEL